MFSFELLLSNRSQHEQNFTSQIAYEISNQHLFGETESIFTQDNPQSSGRDYIIKLCNTLQKESSGDCTTCALDAVAVANTLGSGFDDSVFPAPGQILLLPSISKIWAKTGLETLRLPVMCECE